jgi:hypothetical protein
MAQEMLGGLALLSEEQEAASIVGYTDLIAQQQHGYRLRCASCKQPDRDGCVLLQLYLSGIILL